jgi:hypothetical protein
LGQKVVGAQTRGNSILGVVLMLAILDVIGLGVIAGI